VLVAEVVADAEVVVDGAPVLEGVKQAVGDTEEEGE
jgi:hypothetical protein